MLTIFYNIRIQIKTIFFCSYLLCLSKSIYYLPNTYKFTFNKNKRSYVITMINET